MKKTDDPRNEGHTKEWQDRARVVLDAKKAAQGEASPKQSPVADGEREDVEEKSREINQNKEQGSQY
jgi:hypothetical protein